MNRIDPKNQLLVATHNKGKAKEFKKLFLPFKIKTIFSGDIGIKEPKETGKTFKENSVLKAKSGLSYGLNVLADDSGLSVDSLGGRPGIYSARWAKKYGSWKEAMKQIYQKILKSNTNNFSAKYCCCLTIAWKNGEINSYYGEVSGEICWPPRGLNGFGYDPIFVPDSKNMTFGEMKKKEKMRIDHRYSAFRKIIKNHILKTGQL